MSGLTKYDLGVMSKRLNKRYDDVLKQENQSLKEQIKILMYMVKDHDKFNHDDFKHDLGTCDFQEYVELCKNDNTPKHETVEELQKRLKDFAETISLFDSQADQCPECGIWRTEEMKEHMPNCTVNKIDEWLGDKPEIEE